MITADLKSIVEKLNAAVADAEKSDKGNASAGRRVRATLVEASKACKALRAKTLGKSEAEGESDE